MQGDYPRLSLEELPSSMDWRKEGIITAVRHQVVSTNTFGENPSSPLLMWDVREAVAYVTHTTHGQKLFFKENLSKTKIYFLVKLSID